MKEKLKNFYSVKPAKAPNRFEFLEINELSSKFAFYE